MRAALGDDEPVLVREPGGTPLGESIREMLLHGQAMSAEAEKHLFMAARAELLARVIVPALGRGRIVIADRYHDSTIAYQGGGRGADVTWPEGFPKPDLTFLLALSPEMGLQRQSAGGKPADRIEEEDLGFHRRVAIAYDRLAAAEPERFSRLDAAAEPEVIHREVLRRVRVLRGRLSSSS